MLQRVSSVSDFSNSSIRVLYYSYNSYAIIHPLYRLKFTKKCDWYLHELFFELCTYLLRRSGLIDIIWCHRSASVTAFDRYWVYFYDWLNLNFYIKLYLLSCLLT